MPSACNENEMQTRGANEAYFTCLVSVHYHFHLSISLSSTIRLSESTRPESDCQDQNALFLTACAEFRFSSLFGRKSNVGGEFEHLEYGAPTVTLTDCQGPPAAARPHGARTGRSCSGKGYGQGEDAEAPVWCDSAGPGRPEPARFADGGRIHPVRFKEAGRPGKLSGRRNRSPIST